VYYLTAAQHSALCHCNMSMYSLHYITTLCAFSRHHLTALSVRSAPLDHLIKRVKLSSEIPPDNTLDRSHVCEKHSVYPHPAPVLSAGIHLRYGKLSSPRLAPRAEDRMVNGLSKMNSLMLLTSFVFRILWLFYEMQLLLPGMSID
jgi:hypothetical protein